MEKEWWKHMAKLESRAEAVALAELPGEVAVMRYHSLCLPALAQTAQSKDLLAESGAACCCEDLRRAAGHACLVQRRMGNLQM